VDFAAKPPSEQSPRPPKDKRKWSSLRGFALVSRQFDRIWQGFGSLPKIFHNQALLFFRPYDFLYQGVTTSASSDPGRGTAFAPIIRLKAQGRALRGFDAADHP
jgi:hypothetical protein